MREEIQNFMCGKHSMNFLFELWADCFKLLVITRHDGHMNDLLFLKSLLKKNTLDLLRAFDIAHEWNNLLPHNLLRIAYPSWTLGA